LVAEKIYKNRKRIDYKGGEDDLAKADAYMAALHLPIATQKNLRKVAEYFAEQAILTNRATFDKIVDALFERGHLTGDEIRQIAFGGD